MGYDLVWVLDCGNGDVKLPSGVDFFTYSRGRYIAEMPFVVHYSDGDAIHVKMNATQGLMLAFYRHHAGKYDRLWIVEYDACVFGKWSDFFSRYDNDNADLIAWDIRPYAKDKNWCWFKKEMSPAFFRWLRENMPLHMSLDCCSRLSSRLIDAILGFLNTLDSKSKFFEWVWPTVAKQLGYGMRCLESNRYSYASISPNFTDFKPGFPYHAIKLDVSWKDVLETGRISRRK